MRKERTLEDLIVYDALLSDDLVEVHIIKHLQRLLHQNKRLRTHIEKTGAWAHLKDVMLWKPFDFYHYFCTKYQERYGSEYRLTGNLVVMYQQIDKFRIGNGITKLDYKKFIDIAFEKQFNKINIPHIAHLCSKTLYNHLMGTDEYTTEEEYRSLDRTLVTEAAKFEEYAIEMNKY